MDAINEKSLSRTGGNTLKVRVFSLILAVVLLIGGGGLLFGCRSQPQTGTFTDDAGRTVEIAGGPERLVSFGPSITEILFALDLGDRVVGVSDFCDYPPEAREKPRVGNAFSPALEKIAELEPDLILTVKHEQLTSELEHLGFTYAVLDPKDMDGIMHTIRLVGDMTGRSQQAGALVEDMQRRVAAVTDKVKDRPPVRVFFIVDGTDLGMPWTAGPGSFIDDIIQLAGGENVAAGVAGAWAQLSIEEIVNADPDVIIVQTMSGGEPTVSVAELESHEVWGQLTAVLAGNVYYIDGDLVSRPGPRIVEGLEEMARILHPDIFQ